MNNKRAKGTMGKMVEKLTKRELSSAFAIIDRISRGVSHPYTREFMPKIVAVNNAVAKPSVRENAFVMREQTSDNVVVMRSQPQKTASAVNASTPIIFPAAFYEYFEIVEDKPSKVG